MKNGGLFLLLVCLTFYVIGRDLDLTQLKTVLTGADPLWIIAAALASCIFLCCEGMNIARLLNAFQSGTGFLEGLRYAGIGFFFSAVTPSASGGQPMQLYAMHRKGVDLSKGTLALLGELFIFQLVSTVLAAAGFLYQHHTITETVGNGEYLFLTGMALNFTTAVLLFLVLLKPSAAECLLRFAVRMISLFSRSMAERAEAFLSVQLTDYAGCAEILRRDPLLIAKTMGTTLAQLTAAYSVTYLVYRALGFHSHGFLQVTALQAVLSVSVSALPLPGAVGASEGGFVLLFAALFSGGDIAGAMILSRMCSFYLPVVVTGLASAFLMTASEKV